jgi:release factor glutamine methyltransferase
MSDPLRQAAARFKQAGIENPRLEARLLLAHAMGVRAEDIVAGRAVPNEEQQNRFEAFIARRIAHEPVAYITGVREFWSLPFLVDTNVLIPRPESETLVEEALRRFPDKDARLDVLDLGTGSGCLLLAFLSERPNARGLGIDRSEAAVAVARRNAEALRLDARARFEVRDWKTISESHDVILTNPPYIKGSDITALAPDVAAYEPQSALDGGPDGLDCYREIARLLQQALAAGGLAFVELGQGQAEAVARIFADNAVDVEGFVNDLAYIPRCLVFARGVNAPHVKRKKGMEKETRSG